MELMRILKVERIVPGHVITVALDGSSDGIKLASECRDATGALKDIEKQLSRLAASMSCFHIRENLHLWYRDGLNVAIFIIYDKATRVLHASFHRHEHIS